MVKLNRKQIIIAAILIIGLLYKLLITRDGNFLFNMDNARDMVDVREMVTLHKLRLTGPTSGIEGFYNGPGWYYLLAIPFVLTGGSPYAEVLLMIFLWAVGGYFLLKIAQRWGEASLILVGSLWVASNYVTLDTVYAFNPNPVILLTPLVIYCLDKYLKKSTYLYSISVWFLAGLFFNFEMAFGLFMPPIIFASMIIGRKVKYFSTKVFWAGFFVFILTLFPQLLFNFRHQGILSTSVLNHLGSSGSSGGFNPAGRISTIAGLYTSVLSATLMNSKVLVDAFLILFIFIGALLLTKKKKPDTLTSAILAFMFIPFLGSIILPLNFMPWHLGGTMAAVILVSGELLFALMNLSKNAKYLGIGIVFIVSVFCLINLDLPGNFSPNRVNNDPSSFRNEVAAVDYVYKKAEGKNFKAYAYLPSVIDYPYQYIFWWYGEGKYGYTPRDYAYLPDKPQYISNKQKFYSLNSPPDSGLTMLIMQKDRPDLRDLWHNSFNNLSLISSQQIGPLDIEVRRDEKLK